MKNRKEHRFLTYDKQIALLKQQGMVISDEKYAKTVLEHVGYYELVNGYKAIFKQKGKGAYLRGTSFEGLVALYKCDENLRQLFFKYMLRVEIHMRSLLAYAFTARFGVSQTAYLRRDSYDTAGECAAEINRLIGELDYAANRAEKAPYVCHHRERYGNVPLWVLFKTLSIGTLNRFYCCCIPEIRGEIAAHFPDLREKTLGHMLDLMQDFRNVCAHNDCLYAYHSPDAIPLMPAVRQTAHPGLRDRMAYTGNDLFALLVVFRYLLEDADYRRCITAIDLILAHFDAQHSTVTRADLLRAMGFPDGWDSMTAPM